MKAKLGQIFQEFSYIISGKSPDFNVEQRLYNIAVFVAILISFISIFINIHLNLPEILNYTISIGAMLLIYLYINSRFIKIFQVWGFIFISLMILSVSWFFNDGAFGSVNYIYILALVVFLSIVQRKNRIKLSLLIFGNLMLLFLMYYIAPQWIYPYPNESIRQSDLMFTFIYVLLFSILIFNSLRLNYENEKQLVEVQKQQIEHQHKNMKDSIRYAKEIQQALLLEPVKIKNCFPNSFVFWQPKDIVSGDFYVFNTYGSDKNKTIAVIADSTGHGVPGALITILGLSFINEIIHQYPDLFANEFLDILREKVKKAFQQGGNYAIENHDGMDLALIIFDKQNYTLQYAGANRPIYLIREEELVEFKPNRMPIGVHYNDNKRFTNHSIQMQAGDELLMFTDGYADQFGEITNRKYYLSNLKKLLIKNAFLPVEEQLEILKSTFLNWKGSAEQTDDVLVVGIKF
jgi:serine phosphatase RsbU (regulator of sigma subunit)